mmetsp:Transcript_35241/g.74033  ORF Transcript_35241/g.74033 Transcript_35241/m.74033 type:complete len:301 (+) Transcript_35241:354-1256(+)
MSKTAAATAVVCWFILNISIGNLNGWILKHHSLSYPVMLTTVHMLCCWALSAISLLFFMRPAEPQSASRSTIEKVQTLSYAFCASVACGNMALQYIFVSFAQMVTAASPLFTACLMFLMTGKRYSKLAYFSLLPMCGGVMLCTAGEINFNIVGFSLVIISTLLRGVKSIVQGKLLTAPEERLDALTLLYHMSRSSVVPLGAYAAAFEYPAIHDPLLRGHGALRIWGLIFLSGFVSFFLNVCNFLVTKYTSAVALQVLGNVKVVLSIGVSLVIFGNPVTSWSVLGCVITLGGVAIYNQAKG